MRHNENCKNSDFRLLNAECIGCHDKKRKKILPDRLFTWGIYRGGKERNEGYLQQGSTHEKKPGGTFRLPTVEMKKVDF